MKKTQNTSKSRLHKRNKNRERYDLEALITVLPELKDFVRPNKFGEDSLDFSSPRAVKLLNRALLDYYYGIEKWNFSDKNLCPPIPGRADYIHYVADILSESNYGKIPKGNTITCLDIGTGASCIYPIIGVVEYNWNFIATDIDANSINSSTKIVAANPQLQNKIDFRLQPDPMNIFRRVLRKGDKIDVTICNPPFHASIEDALAGTRRKEKNLAGNIKGKLKMNFAGNLNELVCKGGENGFIHDMIWESVEFADNCKWFTTLVSKQSNLNGIYKALDTVGVKEIRTIPMGTGNKSSRIVAWSFR